MQSPDLSRLAIHTFTNKPWNLAQCIDAYTRKGIPALSVWRNLVDPAEGGIGLAEAAKRVRDSGLSVPALVRGGFFPGADAAARQKAVDLNRQYVDEAKALGAEMVVLVVGAVPGMPLAEARRQVREGIGQVLPHAAAAGVKLAIEPLHPMYAGDKSCVNRMAEAREICEALRSPWLGIAADVYHIWWDPDLEREIQLAGHQKTLFGFHVCDWRLQTRHMLTDRGLMGDGCIDVRGIRRMVEATGFRGFVEVEVFSEQYWAMDQSAYLDLIAERYLSQC
jgi:sugar phosphate isomerase/epimerase